MAGVFLHLRFVSSTRSRSRSRSSSNSRLQPGTNASPRLVRVVHRETPAWRQQSPCRCAPPPFFFRPSACNSLPPPWPAQATSLFPITSRRASLAAFLSRSVSSRPARVGCPFREVWELRLPRCSSPWGSASFPAARPGARAWRCECRRRREKDEGRGGGGAEERERSPLRFGRSAPFSAREPRRGRGAAAPAGARGGAGGSKVALLLPVLVFWVPRTTGKRREGGRGKGWCAWRACKFAWSFPG